MKIEFKITEYYGQRHKETFEALGNMLDVLGRQNSLSNQVCAIMDTEEEALQEIVEISQIAKGYETVFKYIKKSGKISFSSKPVPSNIR